MLLLPKICSLKDTPEETIHIAKLVLYSQWFFFIEIENDIPVILLHVAQTLSDLELF